MDMQPIPTEICRLAPGFNDQFQIVLPGGMPLVYGSFTDADVTIDGDLTVTGTTALNGNVTIGTGEAGIDYTMTFDGETNDGVITWDEDNAVFDIGSAGFTTTGLGTFGNLQVDNINIDGAAITSNTGTVGFGDDNIQTTGGLDGYGLVVRDYLGNVTYGLRWHPVSSTVSYLGIADINIGNSTVYEFNKWNIIKTGTAALDIEWSTGGGQVNFVQCYINISDNYGTNYGDNNDAKIYYDGTDLIIDPDVVGSGRCKVAGRLFSQYIDTTGFAYGAGIFGRYDIQYGGATTGIWSGCRNRIDVYPTYNVSTSHATGIPVSCVSNLAVFNTNSSADVTSVACEFFWIVEDGSKFTGTITDFCGMRLLSVGTGANPIDITNIWGYRVDELDGHSNADSVVGLYIGNCHGAAIDNYAIQTNGGGHILDDYAYIGDVTGSNYVAIEADGDIDFTGSAGLKFAEIYVADASTAQTIPTGATYTKLTAFTTDGQSNAVTADAANDKLTLTAGKYLVTCSVNGSIDTANVTFKYAVFVNGTEQSNVHCHRKYGTANDDGSSSMSGIIDVAGTYDIDIRAAHDDAGSVDLTVTYMNLTAVLIGGT